MPPTRPALFLDRDGTLIAEVNYLTRIEQVRILEGAVEALRLAREAGMLTVLVTNQSAIARGMLTEQDLAEVHQFLDREIRRRGSLLDAIYYCPHHPDGSIPEYAIQCSCRKPNPGLLERAAHDLGLDLTGSLMVGDTLRDVEAAHRAGCTGVLVLTGHSGSESSEERAGGIEPEFTAPDLLSAVRWFLDRQRTTAPTFSPEG